MMISSFEQIIKELKILKPKKIAVAVAQDKDVLLAVDNAYQQGIVNAILIGDKVEIEKIAQENNVDITKYEVVDEPDKMKACRKAVELINLGVADLPMKGFVDTSLILKAALDKSSGLYKGRHISHVGVLSIPGFNRMFIMTDAAMNIAPSLHEKADMINNAVEVAHTLGNKRPKVAVLCAVEKTDPKMPATIDADELTKMNECGEIKDCIVKGPLALDNAVSLEAARHKGIYHPVAGLADILVTPDIEAGNILNKSMEYFGKAKKAGVIMGASVPIILTSRGSSDEAKLNSIALAAMICHMENREEVDYVL